MTSGSIRLQGFTIAGAKIEPQRLTSANLKTYSNFWARVADSISVPRGNRKQWKQINVYTKGGSLLSRPFVHLRGCRAS